MARTLERPATIDSAKWDSMSLPQQRMAYARSQKFNVAPALDLATAADVLGIQKEAPTMIRPSAPAINRAQMMLAQVAQAPLEETMGMEDVSFSENGVDQKTPVRIATSRPKRVRVYVLTPNGCKVKEVSTQGLGTLLQSPTHSPVCFDCGSDQCPGEPNTCPGRAKVMVRRCPVAQCGKRIYDPKPTGKYLRDDDVVRSYVSDDDDDPELIIDNEGDYESTPQMRTKVLMDNHIIGFHKQEAVQMGLISAAQALTLAVGA